MTTSRLGESVVVLVAAVLVSALSVRAAPMEPTENASYRPLRNDYVKDWYIFNDQNLNGILDPGDEKVGQFKNWWTVISTHSQHNYKKRTGYNNGDDWGSGPYNGFTDPLPVGDPLRLSENNLWLPRQENAIHFYMTYSQFDNNDWKNGYDWDGKSGDRLDIVKARHEDRNGYAFGWLTHDNAATNTQAVEGTVKMDVYVFKGKGLAGSPSVVPEWGGSADYTAQSNSNPQLSMSNDLDPRSEDTVGADATGHFHPPVYNDGTGYVWAGANKTRFEANGLTEADFNAVVASMEVQERDVNDGYWDANGVWINRTPADIAGSLTDFYGNPYVYGDAFADRSTFHDGGSDGGVIAGLAGEDDYDPQINNWSDQQVIRIDIDAATLLANNITQVIIWDFGFLAGASQTNPVPIVLDLTDLAKFPENRFYIARVNIPEPTGLAMLAGGAATLLARRRRRRVR